MTEERYPGERRILAAFLLDLRPVVEASLGRDSLLFHAIRRALAGSELAALRHARALFNQLPREVKAELSTGLVARATGRHTVGRRAGARPSSPASISS